MVIDSRVDRNWPTPTRPRKPEIDMNTAATLPRSDSGNAARFAQIVRSSKKAEWHIDRDLLQDRSFDFSRKFLPDGLSRIDCLTAASPLHAD